MTKQSHGFFYEDTVYIKMLENKSKELVVDTSWDSYIMLFFIWRISLFDFD